MNTTLRCLILVLLFFLLFLVRGFSSDLFYDPLIVYFQNEYLYSAIPELDTVRLLMSMLFRYVINATISLGIIWFVFQRKDFVKFAGFFQGFAFVVLILLFMYLLRDEFESGYLLPFYVRRFIIHPLFLLLLLPAFYYQGLDRK